MTKTTETPTQLQERNKMARTLSNAYQWDFNELVEMAWNDLRDLYNERYLDYIYGV